MDRVLVTGGSGFLGKNLKLEKPNWTYISSTDCDLTNKSECDYLIRDIRPDAIVHLAAKVGGIKANTESPADFYYINTLMNTNIIHCAYNNKVKRVLSSLSTCAFPNEVDEYPMTEKNLFDGPPAESNFSYGFSKRGLYVQTMAYRKQYGVNYSVFSPSNIYGPHDNFDPVTSHFVPALIRKVARAKNGDKIEVWGSGNPLRQQLYVTDLARIIPIMLYKHNSEIPLIISPNENLSIKQMTETVVKISGKDLLTFYNGKLDGQYRKDGSNKEMVNLIGEYEFTKFEEGVKKTYEWYTQQ